MIDNTNNTYYESLFSKVFNNIVIHRIIFGFVQSKECSYRFYEDNHIDNKLKFNNIHQLGWMIKSKQYPLIKDKIKSNKYIYIDKESIKLLFSLNDEESNEIIRLLLLYNKRNIYGVLELGSSGSNNDSNKELEFVIQYGNPTISRELLSNYQFKDIGYFYGLLNIALNNKKYSNEILKVLYETSLSLPSTCSRGWFDRVPIDFKVFLKSITDVQIKNWLLDLDLVGKPYSYYFGIHSSNETKIPFDQQTFELLVLQLRIYYKFNQRNSQIPSNIQNKINEIKQLFEDDDDGKLKELQKLILKSFNLPLLYVDFLRKYQESLNEYHLKDGLFQGILVDETNKFISLYRCKSLFSGSKDNEYFTSVLESVINNASTIEWNPVFKQIENIQIDKVSDLLIIDSKDTIDWIHSNHLIESTYYSKISKISFSTIQLALYAINYPTTTPSILKENFDNQKHIFIDLFLKAVSNCDMDTIEYIDMLEGEITIDKLIPFSRECTLKQLYELNQYFNINLPLHSMVDVLLNAITNIPIDIISSSEYEFQFTNDLTWNQAFIQFSELMNINFNFEKVSFLIKNTSFLKKVYEYDPHGFYSVKNYQELKAVDIISLIDYLVSSNGSDKLKCMVFRSQLLNQFFNLLLLSQDSTIDQIKSKYSLLVSQGVVIVHSYAHVYEYLLKRSSKLIKYIYSVGSYVYYANQVNVKEFTYDYILSGSTSFDDLLFKLISTLSTSRLVKYCDNPTNPSNQGSTHGIPNSFAYLVNLDLEYFLDIKRVDIFLNSLDTIKYQLNSLNSGEEDGACESIDSSFPQLAYSDIGVNTFSNYSNSFLFSRPVLIKCCKIMTIDEINQFIQFNSGPVPYFYQFILLESIIIGRLDIIQFILNTVENVFFPFNIYNLLVKYNQNNPLQVLHLFLNNEEYSCKFIDPHNIGYGVDSSGNQLYKYRLLNHLSEHYAQVELSELLNFKFQDTFDSLKLKFTGSFLESNSPVIKEYYQILNFNYYTGSNKQVKSNITDKKYNALFKFYSNNINNTINGSISIDKTFNENDIKKGSELHFQNLHTKSSILNDDLEICEMVLLNYTKKK